MSKLDDIIAIFQSVDPPLRLELLLDYANRLPPLPEQYRAQRDAGFNRIPECMTPVFLWVEVNGAVTLHADVAEESPTVKGFVSILVEALSGASAADLAAIPGDLVDRLGLGDALRMTRSMGLSAIVARLKRIGAEHVRQSAAAPVAR